MEVFFHKRKRGNNTLSHCNWYPWMIVMCLTILDTLTSCALKFPPLLFNCFFPPSLCNRSSYLGHLSCHMVLTDSSDGLHSCQPGKVLASQPWGCYSSHFLWTCLFSIPKPSIQLLQKLHGQGERMHRSTEPLDSLLQMDVHEPKLKTRGIPQIDVAKMQP